MTRFSLSVKRAYFKAYLGVHLSSAICLYALKGLINTGLKKLRASNLYNCFKYNLLFPVFFKSALF